MTRADKWKKRPEVMRYQLFCDHVRLLGIDLPESKSHVTFVLPMPKSWSKKKRAEMNGQPHQGKPDLDNDYEQMRQAICSYAGRGAEKLRGEYQYCRFI